MLAKGVDSGTFLEKFDEFISYRFFGKKVSSGKKRGQVDTEKKNGGRSIDPKSTLVVSHTANFIL